MRRGAIATGLALACALLVAIFALGACGGGGGNGDKNAEEAEGDPPTPAEAYSAIVAEIAEEGSTPELALEAFALAFGPIPGVERPETSEGPNIPSGTGAADLALRHFDEFSSEQQEAIEERLIPAGLRAEQGEASASGSDTAWMFGEGGNRTAKLVSTPTSAKLAQQEPDPVVVLDPGLSAEEKRIADSHARRMGRSYELPLHVGVPADTETEEYVTDGWTVPVRSSLRGPANRILFITENIIGARPDACLTVFPEGVVSRSFDAKSASRLAHEAFHCVSNDIRGAANGPAAWVEEGLAAWAGEVWTSDSGRGQAGPRYAIDGNWWTRYFKTHRPNQSTSPPLYGRSYSAIGFWAQVAAWGSEPGLWRRMPSLLQSGSDNDRAFGQSGAVGQLYRWAPELARRASLGQGWNLAEFGDRFGVPGALRGEPEEIDVAERLSENDPASFRIPALEPALFEFDLPDRASEMKTLTMTLKGHGQLAWPGGTSPGPTRFEGTANDSFCLSEDTSQCGGTPPPPSDTLVVGIVSPKGEASIEFSLSCGGGPHPTPEEAINACRNAIQSRYGNPPVPPIGPCGGLPPGTACYSEDSREGRQRTYTIGAEQSEISERMVLEEGDEGWRVIEVSFPPTT